MNLLRKLRETTLSVVPIVLIVVLLNLTIAPVGWAAIGTFALGSLAIIAGLSLFLVGTDISIIPTGNLIGSALMQKRKPIMLILTGLVAGLFITLAEPQIQVLARQVTSLAPQIDKSHLILGIAIGMGLFFSVGLARIIFKISYRWLIIAIFVLIGCLAYLSEEHFIGIAFDSGGAGTGPLTVPFMLALGVGVATVRVSRSSEQDSFGLVGLSTTGPIAAVLFLGLLSRSSGPFGPTGAESSAEVLSFARLVATTVTDVLQALSPIALLFLLFQLTVLHQGRRATIRMIEGLIYAAIGLMLFLVGVNGAFMPVGAEIGSMIGASPVRWTLIPIGFVLGAVVVLAEPSVWVLTDQVREVSGGSIRKSVIMLFFSIGVSISLALAMTRVITGLPLIYILIPGYLTALVLTFFCPPLFTSIAFDSGAVASGPISNSFLLAFTLGASTASGGNPFSDAFGVVALITMTPLTTIQILGLIYRRRNTKNPAKPTKEHAYE